MEEEDERLRLGRRKGLFALEVVENVEVERAIGRDWERREEVDILNRFTRQLSFPLLSFVLVLGRGR